ncbi:decarboxylase [Nocardia otitidiscaviarum]|uniref:decarboxylase n=1 Tax=Nocardia otitidiscaviarum TaxID=1823 RepID=UPI0004A6D717|nr:decarboxylase [Nocardia otitidiscaviarum]MBF6137502.1 decarboxylase [Nocardia otitidiscaviarum]MBF6488236.1 decarboxylase [Nocardia otitidiscaviarum]
MTVSTPPTLPPKIHPLVRAFLDAPGAVADALERFGSPAHLVFPQVFAENLGRFRDVLDEHGSGYRICYAHKVNQSRAFVRTAERAGIGIDVASAAELASAVGAGFSMDRIEVTGPKGEAFLRALVGTGVTVNADNLWEVRRLAELADAPVPLLLRMSGFPATPVSRFGVPLWQAEEALALLAAHRDRIAFRGFAFHIDSGEPAERVRAVEACLALTERAYECGLVPTVLNIGGGFRQVFTSDADAFDRYVVALRAGLLGRGEALTWGGNTFGFHLDGGAVHGTPVFHKYANTVPATRMLTDLLGAELEQHGGRAMARLAAENLLDIWLEPGKALVDHAGITAARVEFVKDVAAGTTLVNLDVSRDTVTPADQEVMVDPMLLPGSGVPDIDPGDAPVGVFLAGRLCLERDLITNHKVWLPWRPRPGDVIVFPNTGAYHMDLSAANASMHPRPPKLAVAQRGDGFRVCRDEEYEPVAAVGSREA